MKYIAALLLLATLSFGGWYYFSQPEEASSTFSYSSEEIGFEDIIPEEKIGFNGKYTVSELENWQRPAGPLKVGIQAGHWENDKVPDELEGLKKNGGGAVGGGTNERDVVRIIAEQVAERLRGEGVEVDLLPATVPPGYLADAFVSIHADGNLDSSVSGFKIASPRRDFSSQSLNLERALYESYAEETKLPQDTNISRRMRGYYAFNWRRYDHAIHPMTPAVIIETGFLTSPADRKVIASQPDRAAAGIARGILDYLNP